MKDIPSAEQGPGLVLVSVPAGKAVNVGQEESSVLWVVLADPEGNESCVLTPRA